jgi:hypothetical protein
MRQALDGGGLTNVEGQKQYKLYQGVVTQELFNCTPILL